MYTVRVTNECMRFDEPYAYLHFQSLPVINRCSDFDLNSKINTIVDY